MATSSFRKTFILNPKAVKKMQSVREKSDTKVPTSVTDRIKEGKEALARYFVNENMIHTIITQTVERKWMERYDCTF